MLPFLKPRRREGMIIEQRHPDGQSDKRPDNEGSEGLRACSADLIRAVHAKDEDGVMNAIKSAFEILDAMPHEEGEHTNESEE